MLRLFETSEVAENYARYCPFYPNGVAEAIVTHARKRKGQGQKLNLMLDVGCGPGQSTKYFHSYVEEIVGIDPSAQQIEQAQKGNVADNVKYVVAEAENLPFPNNSVDLIVSGMGAHYFEFEAFFKECGRVLKPKGTLALFGYYRPTICRNKGQPDIEATECLSRLRGKCVWHDRAYHTKNGYSEIFEMIPSQEKSRIDRFEMEREYSLHEFMEYVSIWTGYRAYKSQVKNQDHPDILDDFARDLKSVWNLDPEVDSKNVRIFMRWNVFILLAEPPTTLA